MLRVFSYFFLLVIAVAGVLWLAGNPGQLTAEWRGYRIETSVAVVLGGVAVVALSSALVYRLWLAVRRAPRDVRRMFGDRRRRQGYQALTRGMVAVAAGDADQAARHSAKAGDLLDEPPLTMLLAAQTAQLKGDEKAARKFFETMTQSPETAFLGLRGLLNQALNAGERERALELARKAYRLEPKSAWVVKTLFELQAALGHWSDAAATGAILERQKILPAEESGRRRAVLAYQQSQTARAAGDAAGELRELKKAVDAAPALVPAAVRYAERLAASRKGRKAAAVIEGAWKAGPHPELLAPYLAAKQAGDPLSAYRAGEKLALVLPDHPETRLMRAELAIEAQLWGEARRCFMVAGKIDPDIWEKDVWEGCRGRAYRLLARLEEAEHDEIAKAQTWLVKASLAEPDRAWVCGTCGNAVETWSPLCGNCGAFDEFSWRAPRHVTAPGLADGSAEGARQGTALRTAPGTGEGPAALPVPSDESATRKGQTGTSSTGMSSMGTGSASLPRAPQDPSGGPSSEGSTTTPNGGKAPTALGL